MTADKDYDSLISAARLLHRDDACASVSAVRRWRFVLVGSGPSRASLEQAGADLLDAGVLSLVDGGLEPLGQVCRAHVGVLMTNPERLEEGCSNAIMEYMACGLPVICADSGGNSELVVDGYTGFVVPPHDVEMLAARLRLLRAEPDRATQMGAAGKERIRTQFSVDRMVGSWVSIYEQVVAEGVCRRSWSPEPPAS